MSGARLAALMLLAAPALGGEPSLPAPRDAAEARAVLDDLSATETHHEAATTEMTALLAEYRRLGGALDSGVPPATALRRRAEVWSRYGLLIDRANELCDEGKAAIDAVNVSGVMAAVTGTGAAWVAAAAQELPGHSDRHSILCRRNDILIKGFEEERRLNDPPLAAGLARAQWARTVALAAAGAVALLVLAALLLKRIRRTNAP